MFKLTRPFLLCLPFTPGLLALACLQQPASGDDDDDAAPQCETDRDCRVNAACVNRQCVGRPSNGGAGGVVSGGTGGTSGTGAEPATGGTDVAGGTGGTVGGQGGTAPGTGGTPPTIVACPSSISTGETPCTNPCTGSSCGLGDFGRRDCVCSASVYRCASCQFPGGEPPTQQPAGTLPSCVSGVGDNVVCSPLNDRCMLAEEVCACLQETFSTRWDCDDPPWGRPPCPASLPPNGSACGVTRYSCVYAATYCSCEANGLWSCAAS